MRIVVEPDDTEIAPLRAHVDGCDACRELVAAVARFVVTGDRGPPAQWPGSEFETRTTLEAETEIGAYRIVKAIGHGAMGRVYLAQDRRLDRPVALKLLDAAIPDAVAQRRLRAEAQSMARLRDPHVVEVFDVGTSPHGPYVAMFYVEGLNLGQWLAAEPRSQSQIVDCLEQAGRGLAAAHAAAVLHRDFKPANILVGRDGTVRVADFGLAVVRDATVSESRPPTVSSGTVEMASRSASRIAGTPAYMAPEQQRGDRHGPAADQFAFCVTLFEALAGHRPFAEHSPAERLIAIECGRIRPAERPIPRAILAVLRRGLHADPQRRFVSMAALLHALRRPRARGWAVLVGVAIAALGGAQLGLADDPGPASCSTRPLAWPGTAQDELKAAWTRLDAPIHATSRLLRELDERAQVWTDVHRSTCVAATRDATPLVLARLDCLDAQGRDFDAFVTAARSASLAMVEGYATMAARLRLASDCTREGTSWMEYPQLANDVSRVRSAYLQILARGGRDQLPALRTEVLDVIARAEQAGARDENATLCHLVGVLDNARQDHESASEWFERAFFLAKDGASPSLAFDAAIANGVVLGLHRNQIDDAWRWLRHARAALGDRDDNDRRARLLLREGNLHTQTSDNQAALARFRGAEALLIGGVSDWLYSELFGAMGQLLALEEDEAGCRVAYGKAIESVERTRGSEHRDLLPLLVGISTCETDPSLIRVGLAHLDRALQLSLQHQDQGAEAVVRGNLGLFYGVLERPTASLQQLRLSDALVRRSFPENHPSVALSGYQLAAAYLGVGQWREATELAGVARHWYEQQPFDTGSFPFDCELVQAQADLMLGRPSMVDRFGELLTRAPVDQDRVEATIGLSQALLAEGRDDEVIAALAPLYVEGRAEPEISILRFAEGQAFYARALLARDDLTEARRQLDRALSIALPYAADDPRNVVARIRRWLTELG